MKALIVVAKRIRVRGTVQGVGFRPFVFRLATQHGLAGRVGNRSGDVEILVEGEPDAVEAFVRELRTEAPPAAHVDEVIVEPAALFDGERFAIGESTSGPRGRVAISPDLATCERCLAEVFDRRDRRYRYPFTNCTDCGPRYTIVRGTPYDRRRTSMAGFEMCPACRGEFEDPSDRRFHAQANACPDCGPRVRLVDALGADVRADDVIRAAAQQLDDGRVIAVKGVGGYHLAVDATNESAVAELRRRKGREAKPFAVMARHLDAVREFCPLSAAEERVLVSARRPIVLLRNWDQRCVAESVAGGLPDLGVMLAYTPLHHLLLGDVGELSGRDPLLVMTSGNLSGEPIVYDDDEALSELGGIADFFLMHDRPIENRCDDSVTRCCGEEKMVLRRSRGAVPASMDVAFDFMEPILACGAQMKSAVCVGVDRTAIVGPHLGDLDRYGAREAFRQSVGLLERLAQVEPRIIAHDLHPDYASTRFAVDRKGGTTVGVQHHHAHVAGVMAEHGLDERVIGVAFDGSGYGTDGCIWGGEFLIADRAEYERVAHLDYVPLPGGEQAVRQPWRMAVGWLQRAYEDGFAGLDLPLLRRIEPKQVNLVRRMIERDLNCPATSSMGRLFDAVAALVLLRREVQFEGQAAMELEAIADERIEDAYEFSCRSDAPAVVDAAPVIRAIVDDLQRETAATIISSRFHNAVADLIISQCEALRKSHGIQRVALSGGVFQNRLLMEATLSRLRRSGFEAYTNYRVPVNDGGISFGQAAVAAARLER